MKGVTGVEHAFTESRIRSSAANRRQVTNRDAEFVLQTIVHLKLH